MEQSVKDILADDFWIMPATPEYIDKGVPYITSKNIKNGTIDFSKVNYISQEDYEYISKNRPILVGDILISMIGTLGETAEVKETDGLFYGQNMFLVRIDESKVNKRYFLNFFKSNCVKRALKGKQNQSTQKYLKANHIEDLIIPVPDVTKQELIAKQLDKLTYIITLRTNELKQLDDLIKARFVEMFGDPIQNPKGWEVVTIGDIVTEVRYGTSKPAVEGGKYPYLRMNNLTADGHLDLNDLKYIDIPDDEIEKCVVRKGDVLFNRTNSIELVGKTAVFDLPEDMIIAGYIIRVRLTEKMLPEVLSQYMNLEALKGILRGMAKGAVNQANINAQELQSIKVYIPEMELQKQFVKMKEQIYKSKVAVQKALDETQMLFDSLMQEYFN